MTQPYIVQFPDLAAYNAIQALEVNHLRGPVAHANRRSISVEVLPVDLAGAAGERDAVEQRDQLQKHYNAAVRELGQSPEGILAGIRREAQVRNEV